MLSRRHAIGLMWRLGVSAVLLYVVFRVAPVGDVAASLTRADAGYVIVGVALQLLARAMSALRTYRLTQCQRLPLGYRHVLRTLLASNFYNLALPGQISGNIFTVYRYTRLGAPLAPAFAALAFSRLCEVFAFTLLGLVCLVSDTGPIPERGLVPVMVVMLGAIALAWVLLASPVARALGQRVVHRRGGGARLSGRILDRLARSLAAVRTMPYATSGAVFGLAVGQVIVVACAGWVLAQAVGLGLDPATVVWVIAVVYVIAMMPVSVAGLGVREGAVLLLLAHVDAARGDVVAWSFLLMAGTLVAAMLGGIAELHGSLFEQRATGLPADKRPQ